MTASFVGHSFKNILITGASSGIGREVAQQICLNAEHIWICGRNATELKKTQSFIKKINAKVVVNCLVGDLTIDQDRMRLIGAVAEENLDLIVLNAGGGDFGLFRESEWESVRRMIDLNVTASVHLAHAFLTQLKRNHAVNSRRCALVFVSSHAAFLHVPHFAVYASAKSFINSFALTLMQEERASGLDFLLVCPGATATQFAHRAGLPSRMLSAPKSPAEVARLLLSNIGHRQMLIISKFDRLLCFASRILPMFIFDAIIARIQQRLLARAPQPEAVHL